MANKNKLRDFVNDKAMSESVFEILNTFFLKKRDTKDVQMLAAERLASLMLEDAWKELSRFGVIEDKTKEIGNVGL